PHRPRLFGPSWWPQEPAIVEPAPEGSEYVRWVQDSLNRILGLQLPVDGIMGPETRSAIRSFQARERLPVTGIAGPDTERALIAATRSTPPGEPEEFESFNHEFVDPEWNREVGRSGREYIRWVQSSLNRVLGLRLAVDGVAGQQTRSAVRGFQQQRGLTVDGQAGPQTEAALIAAGASPPPGAGAAAHGGVVPAGPVMRSAPGLIRPLEAPPPAYTLYVDLALGSESPARPMTGIFIPENYVPRPQVDLILYLHGHKTTRVCGPGDSISIDGYWRSRYWPLREELNKSRKNIILVAPTLGPESEPGSLTKPGGFDAYLDQVIGALIEHGPYRNAAQSPTLGSIILACHSGGGSPMLKIVGNSDRYTSKIQECWGFDCLYSGYADKAKTKKLFTLPRKWIEWAESHKAQRLFIYYKSSTAIESDYLAKKAKDKMLRNVCVKPSTRAPDHCWVPITHWRERIQAAGFLRDI
ncbi:MAG: peptidoglycan-binding domain-containing protein, partial [Blastocatellia bacterium]